MSMRLIKEKYIVVHRRTAAVLPYRRGMVWCGVTNSRWLAVLKGRMSHSDDRNHLSMESTNSVIKDNVSEPLLAFRVILLTLFSKCSVTLA
jgi:hypothetical protein